MPRREELLLGERVEAATRAHDLVASRTVEDLAADRQRREALLWSLTVLGEASAQLPGAFKDAYPSVNWSRPTQLRNRIVHGYWSIDLGVLHATATSDLPGFVDQLSAVLGEISAPAPGDEPGSG